MNENTPDLANPVVWIVDDDPSVRAALEDLLASAGLAARSFGSIQAFLDQYRCNAAPSCLILDVRMPGQSGLEFQRHLGDYGIRLPVIFITGHGDVPMSVQAMKLGAIEFLTKPFRAQDLFDAVSHGIAQDRRRLREDADYAVLQARWQSLSEGERAVVQGAAQGLLNKQIAGRLNVSEITVKVRRAHAMRKLHVRSLAALVRLCAKLEAQPQSRG